MVVIVGSSNGVQEKKGGIRFGEKGRRKNAKEVTELEKKKEEEKRGGPSLLHSNAGEPKTNKDKVAGSQITKKKNKKNWKGGGKGASFRQKRERRNRGKGKTQEGNDPN